MIRPFRQLRRFLRSFSKATKTSILRTSGLSIRDINGSVKPAQLELWTDNSLHIWFVEEDGTASQSMIRRCRTRWEADAVVRIVRHIVSDDDSDWSKKSGRDVRDAPSVLLFIDGLSFEPEGRGL